MEQENIESELLKRANIPLIINSYNDIFSSFDPRPFNEKALSDDFIIECKRAARDKDDHGIELILAVPKARRNINDEFKIKKRLREHFHKHFLEKEKDITKVKKEGLIWVIIGVATIIAVAFLLVFTNNVTFHSLLKVIEIPGWFALWEGLGKIFIDAKKLEPDHVFYKKMINCEIVFKSY
jgi:hypothetical protein